MITVYGRASSSNVQAVMWGIAELGLRAERLDYGHEFGRLDEPEFTAMTPHGLVPVLRDEDVVIWESCAILRYLAARHGDGGAFWPSDPAARAKVDMWAEWGKTTLSRAFTVPVFWARVRTAAAKRDEIALERALARFDGLLVTLDTQLAQGSYVAGEAFSVADIVCGHVFYRYYHIGVPRAAHPNVEAWYHRLTERTGFSEHVMVSYAALAHPEAN